MKVRHSDNNINENVERMLNNPYTDFSDAMDDVTSTYSIDEVSKVNSDTKTMDGLGNDGPVKTLKKVF